MNFSSFLPSDIEDFSVRHQFFAQIGTWTTFCALKSRNQQNHSYLSLWWHLSLSLYQYLGTEVSILIGMKLVTDRQTDTQTRQLDSLLTNSGSYVKRKKKKHTPKAHLPTWYTEILRQFCRSKKTGRCLDVTMVLRHTRGIFHFKIGGL